MIDITVRLEWDKRYTRGHVPVTMDDAIKEIKKLREEVAEVVKLLSEQDYEYNRKTNDMIERHAEQIAELKKANDELNAECLRLGSLEC